MPRVSVSNGPHFLHYVMKNFCEIKSTRCKNVEKRVLFGVATLWRTFDVVRKYQMFLRRTAYMSKNTSYGQGRFRSKMSCTLIRFLYHQLAANEKGETGMSSTSSTRPLCASSWWPVSSASSSQSRMSLSSCVSRHSRKLFSAHFHTPDRGDALPLVVGWLRMPVDRSPVELDVEI